jgi:tRNA (guanine37-N1)-methyltransferase
MTLAQKPPWRASVITLFPDLFPGPLGASVIGRGAGEGAWALETVNLRDFSDNRYGSVDDTPTGGGAGLIIRPDIAAAALDSIDIGERPILYPSPRGKSLSQADVKAWADGPGLVVFCGRFEGLDQRVIEARNMREVRVGDAVLAGGEVAAMLLLEASIRLLPGVLGNAESLSEESFEDGLLEQDLYTRPREWEGRAVPDILLSGDHAKIAAWKRAERERITRARKGE